MAERAIALGEDDPFDYELALELGWSLAQIAEMPHDEYLRWRAFAVWRKAQRDHAREVAEMRANRAAIS